MRLVLAEHELITSKAVVEEVRRVLAEKLRLPGDTVSTIVTLLERQTMAPAPPDPHCLDIGDPDGEWVVAGMLAARVDMFVTGDQALVGLRKVGGLPIVSSRQFWERSSAES